jgi:hypothetical protein
MKKIILTLIAATTLAVNADPRLDDIPGASYAVFEGSKKSGNVTFYTFDGNPIITVPAHLAYHVYLKVNSLRLDPSAPKPQPVTYEIKPVSKIFKSGKSTLFFYDKHNNVIAEFECYKKSNSFSIIFKDPTVKPGYIGALTTVTAPSWASLKDIITPMKCCLLDLSCVAEKPKHSKKLK